MDQFYPGVGPLSYNNIAPPLPITSGFLALLSQKILKFSVIILVGIER
jgi:hypothetical protein